MPTRAIAIAAALLCAPGAWCAYPDKPVRMLVPFAPGGGSDIVARLLAQKTGVLWNQSVVVDNRGGGGGVAGTNAVAKSAPDGYTLLLTSISIAYAPALYGSLPYDTERELAPCVLLVVQPSILGVHPALPVKSVAELIALAKTKPGEIRYSSGGGGSAPHLAAEIFRSTAGIQLTHVPYKGGGAIVTAVLSGEVQMLFAGVASLMPHIKVGRLRALAVTGTTRSKAAPDLPSIAEAGLPGAEFDGWYGLLLPAATPRDIVARINADYNKVLAAADVQERLLVSGFEPLGGTPQKFADYLRSETRKWTKVVREANIRIE
ncbi:MAG: tripartite tricarboxylate transporter substrate binding protein [Betaproteobacteria bacterium]